MKADLQHTRHIRLTVEGLARAVSPASSILRVTHSGGTSILIDPDLPGITVEDIVPPRTWAEGDIVAGEYAYRRGADGRWRGVVGHTVVTYSDEQITEYTTGDEPLDVLRYAAGEQ